MTLIANYPSKKNLKEHIGKGLNYIETSMFSPQYCGNGQLTVCNRPHISHNGGREWDGIVTMKDHIIVSVS